MSNEVTLAIRLNVDRLKRASILNKADIAETILEGLLSLATDFENRLSALENNNG